MFVDPYTSNQTSSALEWSMGYAAGAAQSGYHFSPEPRIEYRCKHTKQHKAILQAEEEARQAGFMQGQDEGSKAAAAEAKIRNDSWLNSIEENEKVIAQLERDTQAAEAELEQSRRLAKKAEAKLDARKRQYEERIQRLEQTLMDLQKQLGVSG